MMVEAMRQDPIRQIAAFDIGRFWQDVVKTWLALLLLLTLGGVTLTRTNGADAFAVLVVATVVAIGCAQLILLHASHEAWHQILKDDRSHPAWVEYLVTYPLGLSSGMRREHLAHHRFLHSPQMDPDFAVYGRFPRSRSEALRQFFANLSGIAAVRQFLTRTTRDAGAAGGEAIRIAAVQVAIFLAFALTVEWFAYVILWLVPLVSVTKTLTYLRGMAEHGSPDGRPIVRSFPRSPASGRILGSFGFQNHAEHHLRPNIPYYALGEYASAGEHRNPAIRSMFAVACETRGQIELLMQWFRQLPWKAPRIP